MGVAPQQSSESDLPSASSGRERKTSRVPSAPPAARSSPPQHVLPSNLNTAIKQLDDQELDRLFSAVLAERKRRGKRFPNFDERTLLLSHLIWRPLRLLSFRIAAFREPIHEIRGSRIRIVFFNHRNAGSGIRGNFINRNSVPQFLRNVKMAQTIDSVFLIIRIKLGVGSLQQVVEPFSKISEYSSCPIAPNEIIRLAKVVS
jgi:hypothetical protein